MRIKHWINYVTAGLSLASAPLFAASSLPHEQLQVPLCLAAKITTPHQVLAENKQFKIIDVPSTAVNGLALLAEQVHCGHFVNVSHQLEGKKVSAAALLKAKPQNIARLREEVYTINHEKEVNEALKLVVADNIWQTLTHLTAYHNRSATKDTGVQAAEWLKAQFEKMATEAGREDTTTFFVKTGQWYKQPSLVTLIGKDIQAPAVVLGAHMDTLDGRMPGAGDDGSGSSSVMEAARILLASKTVFKRPIYIVWYAAEERGLVGSQYVVEHFKMHNIPVKAALQLDMTGYRIDPQDPTMWVYTDYTDGGLSNYVAKLIDTYVKVPVDYSSCGYGCSDHASWTKAGVPAAFPCESNFDEHNPYIHSASDTMSLLSLEHMTNFAKLAVAFAVELASE